MCQRSCHRKVRWRQQPRRARPQQPRDSRKDSLAGAKAGQCALVHNSTGQHSIRMNLSQVVQLQSIVKGWPHGAETATIQCHALVQCRRLYCRGISNIASGAQKQFETLALQLCIMSIILRASSGLCFCRYVLPGSLPPTALETRTGPGRNFFQAPQPHHHPVPHYSRPGRDLVPENSLAFTYPAHTDAVIWAVPDIEQQRQLFERRDHEEGAMPEGGFGGLQRFGAAQHPLYERKRMASQTVTDAYLPSLQLKPATQSEPGRVASRPCEHLY